MKLEAKKQFQTRSDRVKGVDIHPTEPWILNTLYSGRVQIINYETGATVRTFEVSDLPVRSGRFIPKKNWIVVGSDDFHVRVYNYNTSEKVAQFEAHPDYIRVIAVHPSQPLILTAGDDMTIKLWNWESNWQCLQTFEGHLNYVMYVAFNPKDPNTFASACLDKSVKVWSLGSSTPNFTLDTLDSRGVNFVEYYPHSDKPYLITASDDRTIRVWDYQTKGCVATMDGHLNNVSFAVFHPDLPIIVSGSEDSTVRIWNSATYKLEQTINYGLDRAWCAAYKRGSNCIALGFDSGSLVLQLGKSEPIVSMDPSGKLIWARHSEVFSSVVKQPVAANADHANGQVVPLSRKELGHVEIYPTQLQHSPNGRFVAVSGDGEYTIYTALAWRNKSYGPALGFAWAQDSNEYAVRESDSVIRAFKAFKERPLNHFDFAYSAVDIFGGALLGISGGSFVAFHDWDTGKLVRRVDVEANQIVWADSGVLVTIITSDAFYILKYNKDVLPADDDDDNNNDSFQVLYDISEPIRTGQWVGDCFIYTTLTNKLNYLVGDQSYNISHFDKEMYLLGYLPRDHCVYLADKDVQVSSYALSLNVVEYQTLVLRGDMDHAASIQSQIAKHDLPKIARFLENQGHLALALDISQDPEHKFDLAVQLKDLAVVESIAQSIDTSHKWKCLGDLALEAWNLDLAERAFAQANDLESLLLVYTSTGHKTKCTQLAEQALLQSKFNLAFSALWFTGDTDACIRLLTQSARFPEAAMFALTYGGDIDKSVDAWAASLSKQNKSRLSNALCSPQSDPALFPANAGQKGSTRPVPGFSDDLVD